MIRAVLLTALALAAGCSFEPDLSRYLPCDEQGRCPERQVCAAETHRCVPACGEQAECSGEGGSMDAGPKDAGAGAGDAGLAPLVLDGGPLAAATEGAPYQTTLAPRGGQPPYAYTGPFNSDLPPEFSLSTGGVLSASPAATRVGQYGFDVKVTDDAGTSVEAHYGLRVRPLLRISSQTPLSDGIKDKAYSDRVGATGGSGTCTFALDGGALPAGLTLHPDGTLDGTPTQNGTSFSFGVAVTDADAPPQRSSRAYTMTIQLITTPVAVTMATRSLADGRAGWTYRQTLKAYGGTAPYGWQVVSGLPGGVSLTKTDGDGEISGTPADGGTYSVTVKVTDAVVGSAQTTLPLRVF
ncbi:MAG: Ig domain-containing protein [Myxococcaceae bacterium]